MIINHPEYGNDMLKRLFDWQSGSVHAVAVAAILGKRKTTRVEQPNCRIFRAGFVRFDMGVSVQKCGIDWHLGKIAYCSVSVRAEYMPVGEE